MPFLHQDGLLHCNQVDLTKLANEQGTPLYVYDAIGMSAQVRRLQAAFASQNLAAHLHYSVKANPNIAVLKLLRSLGCGFDIVSGGELLRTQHAGAQGTDVVFSGVGKTSDEIRLGLQAGILQFNVESASELTLISAEARRLGLRAPCAVRINPNVDGLSHRYITTGTEDSKFGVSLAQAMELYQSRRQDPHVEWVGLDMHIGSQLTEEGPILASLRKYAAFAAELLSQGFPLRYLDIGGGLGIRYQDEEVISCERFAALAREGLQSLPLDQLQILLEPGRILVGEAGVLLTRLLHVKPGAEKIFYVVDAAISELLRPALYGAHHAIESVRDLPCNVRGDVVGPICESSDCLGKDRLLPPLEAGSLLVIRNAGAYASSMGNTYNTRRRPAEWLCFEAHGQQVRRAETYEDLLRAEMEAASAATQHTQE